MIVTGSRCFVWSGKQWQRKKQRLWEPGLLLQTLFAGARLGSGWC